MLAWAAWEGDGAGDGCGSGERGGVGGKVERSRGRRQEKAHTLLESSWGSAFCAACAWYVRVDANVPCAFGLSGKTVIDLGDATAKMLIC